MDLYSTQHPVTVKPYCILFHTWSFPFNLIFLVSLGMLVPNSRENGNQIFHTSKHTLKYTLLDKSQLKCTSNTVVTLQ